MRPWSRPEYAAGELQAANAAASSLHSVAGSLAVNAKLADVELLSADGFCVIAIVGARASTRQL